MSKNLYSTFQAAKILGISPDTVLKWIKSGKVPASRTMGGHYRIRRDTIAELILERESDALAITGSSPQKPFQHCWEFNSRDAQLNNGCQDCLVYKTRAKRCYEMSTVPNNAGHLKLFCDSDCKACVYYKYAKEQALNVLIVSVDDVFLEEVEQSGTIFNFRATGCEYECSTIVEKMRPEIVVIDCSIGEARNFCDYIANDSRIPYVRIILTSDADTPFNYDSRKVVGQVLKPYVIEKIEEFINRISV